MIRILCATIIALELVSTAHGATLWSEQMGKWTVQAFANDQTKAFSHCGGIQIVGGNALMFAVNANNGWSMGIVNDKWQLSKASRYNVRYWVDAHEPENTTAVAISPKLFELPIRDVGDLYQSVRSGYRIFVYTESGGQQFELAGASRVLSYIDQCAKAGGRKPAA